MLSSKSDLQTNSHGKANQIVHGVAKAESEGNGRIAANMGVLPFLQFKDMRLSVPQFTYLCATRSLWQLHFIVEFDQIQPLGCIDRVTTSNF